MSWHAIQDSIQFCEWCREAEGRIFAPFVTAWPMIPEPLKGAILFVSEAPPREGGFWSIQSSTAKQDDLRNQILPLLKISPCGRDRGLTDFRNQKYFLLQSFPRPLMFPIGNLKTEELYTLLKHPVERHLEKQVSYFSPSAILALGKAATASMALLFNNSPFAITYSRGGFSAVQGMIFEDKSFPLMSATYLPSGNGRFWQERWAAHIPTFLQRATLHQ